MRGSGRGREKKGSFLSFSLTEEKRNLLFRKEKIGGEGKRIQLSYLFPFRRGRRGLSLP